MDQRALTSSSGNVLSTTSQSCDPSDIVPNEPKSSKESSWKTAYAAARMAVEIANASSDMFLPLKAVVGALSVLLKNYDVGTPKYLIQSAAYRSLQQTTANADQIIDIQRRVQSLSEVLASPVFDQDSDEKARRDALRKLVLHPWKDSIYLNHIFLHRKLAGIVAKLEPLSDQHGIMKFLKNVDHANILNSFVQDIACAVTDYQV
jgi:hypothetical protein